MKIVAINDYAQQKVVFSRPEGRKMWDKDRYDHGMLTWSGRVSNSTMEHEVKMLTQGEWTITGR